MIALSRERAAVSRFRALPAAGLQISLVSLERGEIGRVTSELGCVSACLDSKELTWISPLCSLSWSLFYSWAAAAGTAEGAGTKEQYAKVEIPRKAMSRVPWPIIKERQPRAHLVVATMEADCLVGPDLKAAQQLLQRFITEQKPSSDYATTVVREAGRPELYISFENEGDARKFAAAVEAKAIGTHPSWASQRAFELDSARLAELEASLPPPRTRPRREQTDESLARRIKRGSWTPIRRED
jgi:hypothetical protein